MEITSHCHLSILHTKERGSTTVEHGGLPRPARQSVRSEGAVAGVPETGDDEAVLVKVVVDTDC